MQKILRWKRRTVARLAKRFRRWRKHPVAIPLIAFGALLLIGAIVLLIAGRQQKLKPVSDNTHIVFVTYDGKRHTVPTNATTVGKLVSKLHLKVGKNDRVEPSLDTEIVQDNFRVNIYRAHPVTIVDGNTVTTAYSAAATARSTVAETGMPLYAEDRVVAAPAQNLISQDSLGEVVTIQRSVPINLNLYGTQTLVRTHATTVAGLVAEKHIKLVDGATLMPAGNTPLTANMQVFILNKGVSIVAAQEAVPMPVQRVNDPNLTLGSQAVRQAGANGTRLVTYQVTVDPKTGKEIGRTPIQSVVIQDPVPEILAIGTNVAVPKDKMAIMQAAGVAPGDYGYVDYIVSHEGGWGGTTKYNSAGSGAYGICQALPGGKMASAGADWATNPVTQLRWCSGYAVGRYGSWYGAYAYWVSHHYW